MSRSRFLGALENALYWAQVHTDTLQPMAEMAADDLLAGACEDFWQALQSARDRNEARFQHDGIAGGGTQLRVGLGL